MNTHPNIYFKSIYFSDEDTSTFYQNLNLLMKQFGCYYMSYYFENTREKIRIAFSSNPDWQNEFVGNHLIDKCHLCKSVVNQFSISGGKNLILPWEATRPITKLEKDIALYRSEFDIGENGISFCTSQKRIREYLAFAPDTNTPDFVKHVSKNINLIRKQASMFRLSTSKCINYKEVLKQG